MNHQERNTSPNTVNLAPTAEQTTAENPWPLRVLSKKIAEYIARLPRIWVEAEVITLVRRSGARVQFFTVQDLTEKVSINCKIFTHNLPSGIESGSRIIMCVKPDFWEQNGNLTLHVDEIRVVGLGEILARLERLKQQLAHEGLFSPERKLPLPFLPEKIGLICGRNTKAEHDVVVNAQARWPEAQFEIREVQVQGKTAVQEILAALHDLDTNPEVSVIVIARGGGSVEDLLPFSEETLVRAVAAATTPIVSAIGHETDNPILDFVADFRASTPTDAARKIVPDVTEEREKLQFALNRGRNLTTSLLSAHSEDLRLLRLNPAIRTPESLLEPKYTELQALRERSYINIVQGVEIKTTQLQALVSRLRTLSPKSTLKRGYSILYQENGMILSAANEALPGEKLGAILANGRLKLQILDSEKGEIS